jgi:hypothetical protein
VAEVKAFSKYLLSFLQTRITDIWYIFTRLHDTITTGNHNINILFISISISKVDQDISVNIASRYGLDGPGIESGWGRGFPHPSRPTLGPTQSRVQWVPGLSRDYIVRGMALTTHPIQRPG